MTTLSEADLRTNIAEVLRRVATGEEFTITHDGKPIARLGPPEERRWVSGPALRRVFQTPPPEPSALDQLLL